MEDESQGKVKTCQTRVQSVTIILMPKFKREYGFTLIELLVAISIVAVVFGVIISSAAQSKRASRDLQRQSDLKTIQNALQQYYSDQVYYPTTLTAGGTLTFGSNTYLSKVPDDPTNTTNDYKYIVSPSSCDDTTTMCTSYCLYAALEDLPSSYSLPSACSAVAGYNYAVTPP